VTLPPDPLAVALTVAGVLEGLGVRYTTGGSIASSAAGEPRSTMDIDIVAALGESEVPALVSALSPEFYVDEEALLRAVRSRGIANLIHQVTQLKVDVHVAGGTPLDEQQLQRRQTLEVSDGRRLYVHPPEDILLQKLRWFRRGGETSDRQWRDIVAIIRVQGVRLDRAYLEAYAPVMGVSDLLQRVLDEK
jgi:hypothetical protein